MYAKTKFSSNWVTSVNEILKCDNSNEKYRIHLVLLVSCYFSNWEFFPVKVFQAVGVCGDFNIPQSNSTLIKTVFITSYSFFLFFRHFSHHCVKNV